ncbi:MAG: coenzyme F420-0:L-glutamate ligase [Dehalococcoidia bacterium]|nr:coenzyme F420-0:L-glutamate ligase [Dehalococcoidia bacterium]MCA9844556.1 coenzyme F420-0:L-glutamate ligase [Dehalococcoidia bacterium]MCA9853039.1 coenzyme F420-0:L-glutamate ligase [Dehalococcoidia bacterium]
MALTIFGVPGLPEIEAGSDLAEMIATAAAADGNPLADGDVVCITSKVVSKAEGRTVDLNTVEVSPFVQQYAEKWEKDPRAIELVFQEARRVVRQVGPVLITETKHGFVCANSGVDQSSSGGHDRAVLLPIDPDGSARRFRQRFKELGVDVAVIVTDTFGRPWREAQTDIAIGIAGMDPVISYIGQVDPHGHEFRVQAICVADELAAAAELVKGNVSRVPVGVVRGLQWTPDEQATMQSIIRDSQNDLFR